MPDLEGQGPVGAVADAFVEEAYAAATPSMELAPSRRVRQGYRG